MMRHVFKEFPTFQRLNVTIPCYVSEKVFKFVDRVGFKAEGRKRKTSLWKGKWFDSIMYGILREELLPGVKNGSDN
jgi:RimJ/RimL family protein N-acetyltransferase